MNAPIVFNLDDEDGNKEFELGTLIIMSKQGYEQVKVIQDAHATFLDIVKTDNSFKVIIDDLTAAPGSYTLHLLIKGQTVEQKVKISVFVIKNDVDTEEAISIENSESQESPQIDSQNNATDSSEQLTAEQKEFN